MSALAGLWRFDGRPGAVNDLGRVLAAQRLYGPHDERRWDGGEVALGRALFRTLPEDRFDRQPVIGGEGRFALVADVRLDARDELAATLGLEPALAATMADAALLLGAWERWEDGLFDHVYGDYAFALWDAAARRLVLARDALGGRPLHYHRGGGFFAFATMPKGLHALADVPYAPDTRRVTELLALIPEAGPETFFEGISRVEPGHLIEISPDGERPRRHWDPTPKSLPRWTGDDAAEGLRAELDRAVATRLRGADGRVAAQLSAGFDSAAVASTAARLLAPDGRVVAFTSVPREGYAGKDPKGRFGDEGPLAAATAALYPNMEHVLVRPGPERILDGLDRAFFLHDRPILNACNQRWITGIAAEAQRRGLKVLLSGQMGNMTISYNGLELLAELVARGRLVKLWRMIRGATRSTSMTPLGALGYALGPWMPARLWIALNRWRGRPLGDLRDYSAMNLERFETLGLDQVARERELDTAYRPRKNGFETRLWVLKRIDTGAFGKAMLAGSGLDTRDPTADRRLVEFCLALPSEAWAPGGAIRGLAKRAWADRLPEAVIAQRRKGLQAIDWHEGVGPQEVRAELDRLAQVEGAAEALDLDRLGRLVDEWPDDGRTGATLRLLRPTVWHSYAASRPATFYGRPAAAMHDRLWNSWEILHGMQVLGRLTINRVQFGRERGDDW